MTQEAEQTEPDFAAFEAAANSDESPPVAADETETGETVEEGPINTEVNDEADKPEGDEEKGDKRSKPAHVRINELTKARREAERRAEEAETKLAALERGDKPEPELLLDTPTRPDPNAIGADGQPLYEFGEADPAFIEAITDWKVDVKLAERDRNMQAEQAQAAQKEAAASIDQKWQEKAEAGASKYEDFVDTIADYQANEPCPVILAAAISTSDQGADIVYHLAKNPEENRELARLAEVDPLEAARRFGRLEARFESRQEPQARKITEAPIPPKHGVRGAGGKFDVGADTTDFAAFEKKAKAQG